MLFDADTKWVKRLARDMGLGKRDVTIRAARVGPNEVTFVSAKSDEGLDFIREMETKLPVVRYYVGDDEDERDDEDDETSDDDE